MINSLSSKLGALIAIVPDSVKQFGASLTGVTVSQEVTPETVGDLKKTFISIGVAIISQLAYTLSQKLINVIKRKNSARKSKKDNKENS